MNGDMLQARVGGFEAVEKGEVGCRVVTIIRGWSFANFGPIDGLKKNRGSLEIGQGKGKIGAADVMR